MVSAGRKGRYEELPTKRATEKQTQFSPLCRSGDRRSGGPCGTGGRGVGSSALALVAWGPLFGRACETKPIGGGPKWMLTLWGQKSYGGFGRGFGRAKQSQFQARSSLAPAASGGRTHPVQTDPILSIRAPSSLVRGAQHSLVRNKANFRVPARTGEARGPETLSPPGRILQNKANFQRTGHPIIPLFHCSSIPVPLLSCETKPIGAGAQDRPRLAYIFTMA